MMINKKLKFQPEIKSQFQVEEFCLIIPLIILKKIRQAQQQDMEKVILFLWFRFSLF
jgi:hypothetical protein